MFDAFIFTVTFLLCSCSASYYNSECATHVTNPRLNFSGLPGRYELKWCVKVDQIDPKTWDLTVHVSNKTHLNCVKYDYRKDNSRKHSAKQFQELDLNDLNCSTVCLSTPLDLIYRGCYTIKTFLETPYQPYSTHIVMQYIDNKYDLQYFNNVEYLLSSDIFDEEQPARVVLKLFFGRIPVTDYDLVLCDASDLDNTNCTNISSWCNGTQPDEYTLLCSGTPAPGHHVAYLRQRTTWSSGDIFSPTLTSAKIEFVMPDVLPSPATVPAAGAGSAYVGIVCGAVLLLVLAACGILLLCRADSKHRDNLKALVQRGWRQRYAEIHKSAEAGREELEADSILLLYARDCAPLMQAAATLANLLRDAVGCTVYDVHSPAVLQVSAGSPHAWMQRAVVHPRVRLVLLETHTVAALYSAGGDLAEVSAPVLGSRARYRRATAADALLQYALRLLQDRACDPMAYRKYYIGRISTMQSDVLPTVVPFRRYLLPEHTRELLADLRGGTGPAGAEAGVTRLAEQFATQLADFAQFVADNPNYLVDHLVFF